MAHESFEDGDAARALNRDFVAIKVDKEERPDIDGVYMRACQAMTGSGGWPTSIFMSAEGKPFFAGTYFPREHFMKLLEHVGQAWKQDRTGLIQSGERIAAAIGGGGRQSDSPDAPIAQATADFRRAFDREFGGFGGAPKFPSPHNLMFLLHTAPDMAEKTLLQMYRGGIFDHVGGGFSRYSTDRRWLVPHFEKMLYDNALLAMAYLLAYERTGKALYRRVADQTFSYLERELMAREGGFFAAQDADSDGEEGKYYVFTPEELTELLGEEDGAHFCRTYGITRTGNFERKSIPNLLDTQEPDERAQALLAEVYEYRRTRAPLHMDSKLLTAWNALTAAAYAMAGRITGEDRYLRTAKETLGFIERELVEGDTVFVGQAGGKRLGRGFLDDYAFLAFALIQMHQATLEADYLARAALLAEKTISSFGDEEGGFFFSGKENEALISRPKESWDGAVPSGNSVMAYNLSRLSILTGDGRFGEWLEKQRGFMNGEAAAYPRGYGFYLYAALPVKSVVCALRVRDDLNKPAVRSDWVFRLADGPGYPLINDRTTYYVCENGACLPPVNELSV